MKAFIGQYFKTEEQAIEAYNKLSEALKDRRSIVQIGDSYLIVSNDQIEAVNKGC